MADQKNKNLNIKLSFDVDSAKVIGSFDEINKGIDLSKSASLKLLDVEKEREQILADALQKTTALETQKRSVLKDILSSYSTVKTTIDTQNISLANGTTTLEKATAIIQRQIQEVNKVEAAKLVSLSTDLKLLEATKEQVELDKKNALLLNNFTAKYISSNDLIYERILRNTSAIKAFNLAQASAKAEKETQAQDAIAERLAKRNEVLKASYTKQLADAKKAFDINIAIAMEGENSITAIKLKAKQEQQDIEKAFNDRMSKLQSDFVNSEKAWTNPSAQISQAIKQRDQAIVDLNVRLKENIALAKEANKEASGGGRPSMGGLPDFTSKPNVAREEALKRELTVFDAYTREEQAKLKNSIDVENAMQIHGINSIQVARLQANEQIRQAEVKLQADLVAIRSKVSVGSTTSGVSNQVAGAYRQYRSIVDSSTVSLDQQEKQVVKTEEAHRNLFNRVGLGIIAYRAWNTALTTIEDTISSIPKIGIELESTQASLTATTGSAAAMNSVMIALKNEAQRTGIEIITLRENFRSFQASTSLAGESIQSTWHMFTNLNTVITGLHLSSDKANGIFLAMAQIFNKGKVQSEELVKQLGNLLPGAFAIFAAANSTAFGGQFKNTIDLIDQMKKGMVFAHETVEKFTQFMADRFEPSFALASHGLNASIGRMSNSFTLLKESIYASTSGSIVFFVNALTSLNTALREDMEGANNLGRILTVGLGAAMIALATSTAKSAAASIANTAAKLREAASFEAVAVGASTATVAVESYSVASNLAVVASASWARALAFFNPVTIVAGIAMIGVAIAEHFYNANKPIRDLNDFLEKTSENLDKINSKPVSLELKAELDPSVVEGQKVVDAARKKIEDLNNELVKHHRYSLLVDIQDAEAKLKIADERLVKLKDAAYIKVQADTTEFMAKLTDAADKMNVLFLQSQGKIAEAAQIQFDVSHGADVKAAEAFISRMETVKEGMREIDRMRDTINRAHLGQPVDPKKVDEALTFVKGYDDNVRLIQQASELRNKAGKEEEIKIVKDATKAEMELREKAAMYSKNVDEIRVAARYKAEKASLDEVALLQKEARQIESRYAEGATKSPEDTTRLKQLADVIELSKQGIQRAVDHAVDQFNKEAASSIAKTIKVNYKDFERDITQYTATGKTALDSLDARYAESKVSVFTYYKEKQQIQLETLQKQKELYAQEINFAGKSGDSAKIDELRDKIALLDEQIKQVPDLISIDKKKGLDEYNKSLVETAANYQELIGNYQEAERLRFGAIENPKIAKFQAVVEDNTATQEDRVAAKNALLQEKAIQANAGLSKQVNAIQTKIADINNTYTQQVQLLNTKIATGVESQWSGMLKLRDMNKERIQQLQEQVNLQQQAVEEARNLAAAATNSSEKDRQLDIAAKTQKQMDESKISLESLKAEGDIVANHFQTVIGDAFQSSFEGLIMGTQTAKQAFTSFATSIVADIAKIVASEIRSQILGKLVGMAFSAVGGYFGSSTSVANGNSASFSSAMSGNNWMTAKVANGGVFSGTGISAHSGSVVSTPTVFPFATGIGLMGEAGPEAILPLKRDSSGKLGVRTTGDKSGQSQGNVYNISVTVQGSKDDKPADTGQKIADVIMRNIAKEEIFKAQRPGNILNKTTNFG